MPTSDPHNISPIMAIIQQLAPKSVLDVGCGFGKYGVLLREYLDVWHKRYDRAQWEARIVGVEAFEGYRNDLWSAVYDQVHVADIRDVLPSLGRFDVALVADVIEHFELPTARQLVDNLLAVCDHVVISTPSDFYPQADEFGNEYERHRCHWTARQAPSGKCLARVPALACDIFVISNTAIHWEATYTADLRNVLYLRSRRRLRFAGQLLMPVSYTLRVMSRLLS